MTAYNALAGTPGASMRPLVREITPRDVLDALREGYGDFLRKPSHYAFVCLVYPIAGAVLVAWSLGFSLAPMIYPLMSGFALIGPLLALGLYEISRRLERGEDPSWRHALDVLASPAWFSLLAMSAYLVALFVAWLFVAQGLYVALFGDFPPVSFMRFAEDVIARPNGWQLIVLGNLIGFGFAVVALATSIVAFPLLLDRDVGAAGAIETSVRASFTNPGPVALWGLIVAVGLAIGMASLLVGLIVVFPILGHATWRLYRKIVIADDAGVERTRG